MKHVWTGEECTVAHSFPFTHLGLKPESKDLPKDGNFQCWVCANCDERIPWDKRDEECPGPKAKVNESTR